MNDIPTVQCDDTLRARKAFGWDGGSSSAPHADPDSESAASFSNHTASRTWQENSQAYTPGNGAAYRISSLTASILNVVAYRIPSMSATFKIPSHSPTVERSCLSRTFLSRNRIVFR